MNDVLSHRGPDASGVKLFKGRSGVVGLGHRRLSIIDLAGGKQPMSNEDGTVWISYNGEIYNHAELRSELLARGHRYKTRCDTETVVHAYEEWGADCVKRFRGMFAFVVWDSKEERLFAARDRMGIKPLYYSYTQGDLLFSSEVKALFASGWCTPQLNFEALPEHLTLGYVTGKSTLFSGILELLPGNHLTWHDGELRSEQYWEIPLPRESSPSVDEAELIEQFLSLFRESVRLRLMSDVPLGVFLSGGLDSSAIAATMAAQLSEPVNTFSVDFDSEYSEAPFAREVATAIGANHHEVVLKPERLFSTLPRLIWHEDEPIRNSSSVALYEVSKLAQTKVKVVLTGEGSDELFGGYERYWATLVNMRWGGRYQRLIPHWLREQLIRRSLWQWPCPLSLKKKLSHTFLNHSLRPEQIIFDNWYAIFAPRLHRQLFTTSAWQSVSGSSPYRNTMQLYESRDRSNLLDRLLFTDQKSYLVELLRKQDRMSMAASIESRVPFLDHHLVEFAAGVPSRYKIRGTQGKHLIKKAMRQVLPKNIVYRKKMGFPVPLCNWLRHQKLDRVVRSILMSKKARNRDLFNVSLVEQMIDQHSRGARDNSEPLWTLLNFEVWQRIFLDGESCTDVSDEMMEPIRSTRSSAPVGSSSSVSLQPTLNIAE